MQRSKGTNLFVELRHMAELIAGGLPRHNRQPFGGIGQLFQYDPPRLFDQSIDSLIDTPHSNTKKFFGRKIGLCQNLPCQSV